ncbi:MAG: T9SS type A sorting domain-containing protein, partial [Flavobacteriales bacterium]|nr:T9SS type A sorting domain-containing protein [Flavobacteriales bacterium]
GKTFYTQKVNDVNISINLQGLPSGIYFIKFKSENESLFQKMIKN